MFGFAICTYVIYVPLDTQVYVTEGISEEEEFPVFLSILRYFDIVILFKWIRTNFNIMITLYSETGTEHVIVQPTRVHLDIESKYLRGLNF